MTFIFPLLAYCPSLPMSFTSFSKVDLLHFTCTFLLRGPHLALFMDVVALRPICTSFLDTATPSDDCDYCAIVPKRTA